VSTRSRDVIELSYCYKMLASTIHKPKTCPVHQPDQPHHPAKQPRRRPTPEPKTLTGPCPRCDVKESDPSDTQQCANHPTPTTTTRFHAHPTGQAVLRTQIRKAGQRTSTIPLVRHHHASPNTRW
jgi:hypothetical protein